MGFCRAQGRSHGKDQASRMIRRQPIKRSTTPIPRNIRPKAKRAGKRRVSVLRDRGYRDFLREEGKCLACIWVAKSRGGGDEESWRAYANIPVTPGRIRSCSGRSSKGPDSSCIPLCDHHHAEMDGRLSTKITTKAAFAAKYGLDLAKEAATHYAAYLIVSGKLPEGEKTS